MNKTNIEHPTSNTEHQTWGDAAIRMKTPNPKTQIPNKLQVPSSKAGSMPQVLEFEVWDFSGAWGLVLGFAADHGPLTTDQIVNC